MVLVGPRDGIDGPEGWCWWTRGMVLMGPRDGVGVLGDRGKVAERAVIPSPRTPSLTKISNIFKES